MTEPRKRKRKSIATWRGETIRRGEGRDVTLVVGESYSSMTLQIPLHIRRAKEDGPVVFITAALHGDEINGTGAVRQLLQDPELRLTRGAVILVPVLNMLAFERFSRYLPDRRDLNRCFPGSANGSLARRMARVIFDEIVKRSDYGIDLHTAAVRRTNYPTVRGDMRDPEVARIANAFGAEIIMNKPGPKGALRSAACLEGCPTIVMEGGEVWKVEPGIVESATRGIYNVLRELSMCEGEPEPMKYQVLIEKTKWIRASRGGFLSFHITPGDVVEKGQPLVTNTTLLGSEQSVLYAPYDAVVLGMTTLPATSPGEPVCNLGRLPDGLDAATLRRMRHEAHGLESQVVEELSSNVLVADPPPSAS